MEAQALVADDWRWHADRLLISKDGVDRPVRPELWLALVSFYYGIGFEGRLPQTTKSA